MTSQLCEREMRQQALGVLVNRWHRQRGFECLLSRFRDFRTSQTSQRELFSAIVVLDLLAEVALPARLTTDIARHIQEHVTSDGLIHFFERPELLPPDADCTALGSTVLARVGFLSPRRLVRVANTVVNNVAPSGVVQVYFDPAGERANILDPVVCVNVLHLANLAHINVQRIARTEEHVWRLIEQRRHIKESRYYVSEDTFLYFAARLVRDFPQRYSAWRQLLTALTKARLGKTASAVEYAQRAIAASVFGLSPDAEMRRIRTSRRADGTWPPGAFFRFGRRRVYFGSEVLSTAFALRASMFM